MPMSALKTDFTLFTPLGRQRTTARHSFSDLARVFKCVSACCRHAPSGCRDPLCNLRAQRVTVRTLPENTNEIHKTCETQRMSPTSTMSGQQLEGSTTSSSQAPALQAASLRRCGLEVLEPYTRNCDIRAPRCLCDASRRLECSGELAVIISGNDYYHHYLGTSEQSEITSPRFGLRHMAHILLEGAEAAVHPWLEQLGQTSQIAGHLPSQLEDIKRHACLGRRSQVTHQAIHSTYGKRTAKQHA